MYYLVNIVVLVDESQAKHRNADHHVLEVIFCQTSETRRISWSPFLWSVSGPTVPFQENPPHEGTEKKFGG